MKVILKDSMYEMNRKQFRGVAEMKNETFESKEELKKVIA